MKLILRSLRISRNSKLFQDMQIRQNKKTLEFLRIFRNGLKNNWEFHTEICHRISPLLLLLWKFAGTVIIY